MAGRVMTAAMFADLTGDERRELASRLRRAGHRFGEEASMLAAAPSSVLACYCLPREGYHDFYSAAIESSLLSVEARGYEGYGQPERKLLHLNRHDLAVLANSGDAEALAEWEAREHGGTPAAGDDTQERTRNHPRAAGAASPRGAQPPLPQALTPADLPDTRCPDCGYPRTGCGCSCTGPGTCGGGTDDVQ